MRLRRYSVFITGAASGIGRGLIEALQILGTEAPSSTTDAQLDETIALHAATMHPHAA